jgi:hypothetical protein
MSGWSQEVEEEREMLLAAVSSTQIKKFNWKWWEF